MIGKLKGIIDSISEAYVIIDVSGVGYFVYCPASTLRNITIGAGVTLYIETHVREDHIHLYGFLSEIEKKSFQTLVKVNGVGTKMAIAILSSMTPDEIAGSVAAADKVPFTRVSGVGPKLAARLVTELKDKFDFAGISGELSALVSSAAARGATKAANNDINDAVAALVNLGYNRTEAFRIVNKAAATSDEHDVSSLIKVGLKQLGK